MDYLVFFLLRILVPVLVSLCSLVLPWTLPRRWTFVSPADPPTRR
jgi:hypothetical protein